MNFTEGEDQDFTLSRIRFSTAIKPTPWMTLFGEVQDDRSFGLTRPGAGNRDTLDIRQAYVQFGREDAWWDVKAGRQKMFFGSERVIGAGEWGNTARVFDAVRFAVHHGPNRVDFFSSSVVNPNEEHWDHHQQGNNLHGAYGSLGSILKGSKIEPYVLYRTDHLRASHSWTSGIRTAGAAGAAWNYELELIGQRGAISTTPLHGSAATVQVQRHFDLRWKPTLLGEFNYASGDKNPTDKVINTYDQLYPTNHGIYGVVDIMGRRNTKNGRAGLWLKPKSWLTTKAEVHTFALASRFDALYSAGGGAIIPAVAGGARSTDVGREIDLIADFKLNPHYDIGAQYGHLIPGAFVRTYSPGASRNFYAFFLDFRL